MRKALWVLAVVSVFVGFVAGSEKVLLQELVSCLQSDACTAVDDLDHAHLAVAETGTDHFFVLLGHPR